MYNLLETEIDEISLDPNDIPSTVDGDVEEEEDDGLNAEKNKEEAIELEKGGSRKHRINSDQRKRQG